MNSPSITIIGAGNMGGSLIHGLIRNAYPKDRILACDPSNEIRQTLENTFHIRTTNDNHQAAEIADVIIFAVKPQYMAAVLAETAKAIEARHTLVISVAAGIRVESLQACLKHPAAIVRAMPNTPALIGCAATALYANPQVSAKQRELAESILRAVGITVWLEQENLMDTVTALSGSGPAYFFLIMEALEEAASQLGLPFDIAHLLTLETALGAVRMAIEGSKSLSALRHQVTSPQGTTEKAISVLESNNIRGLLKQALLAAKLRSEELGK